MRVWALRKGAEKRFQSGHPWVFSNELAESPKGASPGEPIELVDFQGRFLALGYGNPKSLIAFRTLSRTLDSQIQSTWWADRFQVAYSLRANCGIERFSHRLIFAESDGLPGLIIDRYKVAGRDSQIFVISSSTAGIELQLTEILKGLELFVKRLAGISWDQTCVVMSNTSAQRRLEGLEPQERRVEKSIEGLDLNNVTAEFEYAGQTTESLPLSFDLLGGQKTGFFLDQRENLRALFSLLKTWKLGEPLRILDLCCYVGQWSAQISEFAKRQGLSCEVTLMDSSDEALKWASKNCQGRATLINPIKNDVLNSLRGTLDRNYDVVICDPPAFIKKKKDVPQGKAAYAKLNREAIRKVLPGGLFVSCSCSGLFTPEEFRDMLAKASASRPGTVWIKQGYHSPDHPQRLEFPEGQYLKCLIATTPH